MDFYVVPSIEIVCWTAGFLDADGSIWPVNGTRYGLVVCQSSVNGGESLLRELRSQWGVGGIFFQRSGRPGYGLNSAHGMWAWRVDAARELQFVLRAIVPHLRVKRDRSGEDALRRVAAHLCLWRPSPLGARRG